MDMTLWDAEQQHQGGISSGLGLPRSPWIPSPCLGGKPTLCGLLWFSAGEAWLPEGHHHSSFKLEAEQATAWIEGAWEAGNFRNSDELRAAPRNEFYSTYGSCLFAFFY